MNKKMEELYAHAFLLGDWVKELNAEIDNNPDDPKNEARKDLVVAIGMRMLTVAKELDKERTAYQKLPLWKQLLRK